MVKIIPNNNNTSTIITEGNLSVKNDKGEENSMIKVQESSSVSERKFGEIINGGFSLNKIRKSRKVIDDDVMKLHNRIRMLQLEEEKALKKIDETRRKAKTILDIRMNKEQKVKRHSLERALTPDARQTIYIERKEEHKRVMHERLSLIMQKRKEEASLIKKERRLLSKKKNQIDQAYLQSNQLRRMEIYEQAREGQERVEQQRKRRMEESLRSKEREWLQETRRIRKQERRARRLELREQVVLQRLKETHMQQKEAIEDIQRIMKATKNNAEGIFNTQSSSIAKGLVKHNIFS